VLVHIFLINSNVGSSKSNKNELEYWMDEVEKDSCKRISFWYSS